VDDLRPLVGVSREHLAVMSDATGIMQHAIGSRPDPVHGYCTDDVARALRVDLLHQRELGWPAVAASAGRNLAFLGEAFLPAAGRFRNFRAVGGSWLDHGGSADSQGRALQALGETILLAPDAGMVATASLILGRALPAARDLADLRARASALLGCVAAVRGGMEGEAEPTLRLLAGRLHAAFQASTDPDWPWPEPILTYENGLPVHALIVAGDHLGDRRMLDAGLRTLDWLVESQAAPAGHLSPVGNGWWPRGGVRSRFDQQPIEAAALLLAAYAGFAATGRARYRGAVEQAYGWFLGANDGDIPVADASRGACFDALTPDGVNINQGAESTLVWLTALEHVRLSRSATPSGPRAPAASRRLASTAAHAA
jgi:hypothetical protein